MADKEGAFKMNNRLKGFYSMVINVELRKEIAWMIHHGKEGHIPSAYSIIDIINFLYDHFLQFDPKNPKWEDRDFFILSKGHGCAALYSVLKKHGFISQKDIEQKTSEHGILGGHPDVTKVPGAEASTGSLGHGIGIAVGIALGLKIKKKPNRVICLIGDGESNEGTVWESALVAAKYKLGNLCVIADHNGSADLVLPVTNPVEKWTAFGWNAISVDGHNMEQFECALESIEFKHNGKPNIIIARTKKGKGVDFIEENFGYWHSRVPDGQELQKIYDALEKEMYVEVAK